MRCGREIILQQLSAVDLHLNISTLVHLN